MSCQQILRELASDVVANRFFFEHEHPLTLRCRFCAWCNQFRFIGYPFKHIGQLLVLSGVRNSCDGSCSLMLLNCCGFFARKLLLVEKATAQVLFGPHILDLEQTSHCAPAYEVLSKKSAETVGQHPQREKKSEHVGVRADICVFFIQSAEHWMARDVKQVQTLDPIHEFRRTRPRTQAAETWRTACREGSCARRGLEMQFSNVAPPVASEIPSAHNSRRYTMFRGDKPHSRETKCSSAPPAGTV